MGMEWSNVFDVKLAIESLPYVLGGVGYTLLISLASMIFGLIFSFFLALGRQSSILVFQWSTRMYISFMRGTPILVLLFILYFGFPVIGIEFSAVTAAILGFSLNSAAYMAEINRASFSSIPIGQWDAARALGFPYWKTLRSIIVPQSVRIAIPPLSNVLLDLVKSSSLAMVITVPELFHKAKVVAGRTYDSLTMYILIAVIYWVICILISALQNRLEKRFNAFM